MTIELKKLTEIAGARLIEGGGSRLVSAVSANSKAVPPDALFVPLKGDRHDGHDFLEEAVEAGATAVMVERGRVGSERLHGIAGNDASVIEVPDCLEALQAVAAYVRRTAGPTVVAVTGSVGKTSTKDLITSVLSRRKRVVSAPASYNNDIGVPLTLLKTEADTEVMVVEMAMRGAGEIRRLVRVADPDVAVVTNVGPAHLETVGSTAAVFQAKAELVEEAAPEATVVLNRDDNYFKDMRDKARGRVISFGLGDGDVHAAQVRMDSGGRASFDLKGVGAAPRVSLSFPGAHHIPNALAAAAVGTVLGIDADAIVSGLKRARLGGKRMEVTELGSGLRIVDDSYNANPVSMNSALKTISQMEAVGRKIAVLGGMLELGSYAEEAHLDVGKAVAEAGFDWLVVVGELGELIARGALGSGFDRTRVLTGRDRDEAFQQLMTVVTDGDLVLVKASRAVGLDEIASRLTGGVGHD